MKLLFYNSRDIGELNILWGIIELGIDVDRSDLIVDCDLIIEKQVEAAVSEVKEYDIVITRNFSVNIAEACHIANVPYVAWCYDSMLIALYSKEALYSTNHIFSFDKKCISRLKALGVKNVYYQPLAANMLKAGQVCITDYDLEKYKRDVSRSAQHDARIAELDSRNSQYCYLDWADIA